MQNESNTTSFCSAGCRVGKNIPGGPIKTEQSIQSIFQDFALINSYLFSPCWIEHLSLIIITPRSSNLVETWELFIFWVISYGLSFSGFARFPEFRGTINDKSMANPENDSPEEITHKIKSSQPNSDMKIFCVSADFRFFPDPRIFSAFFIYFFKSLP